MISHFKRITKRYIPYAETMYETIASFLAPDHRKSIRKNKKSYKKLKHQFGSSFCRPLMSQFNGKVLFMGQSIIDFIPLDMIMLKSFELAGYEPFVLASENKYLRKAYKLLGVYSAHHFQQYCPEPQYDLASKILSSILDFNDLLNLKYKGVCIGKYAASSMMRKTRKGYIDLEDETVRQDVAMKMADSIAFTEGSFELISKNNISAVVLMDRGYSPSGELFDVCFNAGVPCFIWHAAHRSNTLMMKRYSGQEPDSHPSSLSKKSWRHFKTIPFSKKEKELLYEELYQCYSTGEWYSEVGTQFDKQLYDADSLKNIIGLKDKPSAVIFSHIFWDATFFWGRDLFRDYEEWFIETIKAACKNDRLDWIIKVHPANKIKNRREGVTKKPMEIQAINKYIGNLPPHVHLLPEDTEINTFSLFQIMDYCVTVRGTVGIEAAALGKTVLTAGTGRYDHKGFTHDFETREEYLNCLSKLETIPLPTEKMHELAERYAYGIFVKRPVTLQTISMVYQQDEKASLSIKLKVKSNEELKNAKDINAIAEWIASGDEDFVQKE